jgi:hypothetical protein
MRKIISLLLIAVAALTLVQSALGQGDAVSKALGEYGIRGSSARRSMHGARDYSRDYRQYTQSVPAKKVNPEVAKEAADTIGDYIVKAETHFAWMRKQAAGDPATLASLDSIDKNLAAAAKSHKEMHEICAKSNVDAPSSMKCCEHIDESLSAAIAEHDTLMKRLAGDKAEAPKK